MSEYEPPIEDVPIFNSDLFYSPESALTIAQADKRYLKFPQAQGDENLRDVTVSGNLTMNASSGVASFHRMKLTGTHIFTANGAITAAMSGHTIYANSGTTITLTLPSVSNNGLVYNIVALASSDPAQRCNITTASGSELFIPNNTTTLSLITLQNVRIVSNGTAWIISGGYSNNGVTTGTGSQSTFWMGSTANYWSINGGADSLIRRYIGGGNNTTLIGSGNITLNNSTSGSRLIMDSISGSGIITLKNTSSYNAITLNASTSKIQIQNANNIDTIGLDGITGEITGAITFPQIPLCSATYTAPTSTSLITKGFADATYTGSGIISGNNTWTGTNAFNTSLPTSTLTPTTGTQLITKTFADTSYASSGILGTSNIWTNTNTFNGINVYNTQTMNKNFKYQASSYTVTLADSGSVFHSSNSSLIFTLPTGVASPPTAPTGTVYWFVNNSASTNYTILGTLSATPNFNGTIYGNSGLVNGSASILLKPYNTVGMIASTTGSTTAWMIIGGSFGTSTLFGTNTITANNDFSGTNTFNTNLPTSTVAPTTSTQLITKNYGDTTYALISGNNTMSGINTFTNNALFKKVSSSQGTPTCVGRYMTNFGTTNDSNVITYYPFAAAGQTASTSPTSINAATTLSAPLFGCYFVYCASNYTITLPPSSDDYQGIRILFRRVIDNSGVITIASNPANPSTIMPINGFNTVNSITMSTSQYACEFRCYNSAPGINYYWFCTMLQ